MSDTLHPESVNPYKSAPQNNALEQKSELRNSAESFGAITEDMISSIKQSSSWIRFLSICGFIYAGLFLVPTVVFLLLMPFVDVFSGSFTSEFGVPASVFSIGFLILVLAVGALIIIPLIFLHNIGSKMRTFVQTNNESALELAFKNNKSFWKFCGILTIILLALLPVSLIIAGVLYVY